LNGQLELFAETAVDERTLTREQVGLRHDIPPGPARLLGELVKRGVADEDLRAAVALCLALDERVDA
jgi:hypothetical protein